MVNSCIDSPAVRVSHNDDQIHSKVKGCVLDTAELMVINYVAGDSYNEKIADSGLENGLRDHSGV